MWPLKEMEFWGMLATLAVLWFSNMGGVGGAGVVLPICLIFFRFDPKSSIPLSNFSIFLACVVRYLLNSVKSHPLKNGKGILVDHNLIIVMLPLIISGVSIGVIANLVMPNVIVMASYVILLTFILVQMIQKTKVIYRREHPSVQTVSDEKEVDMVPI